MENTFEADSKASAIPGAATAVEEMSLIRDLSNDEGASVTILCANPDPATIDKQYAIEVSDEWTVWESKRFHGESILRALQAAKSARDARRAN